MNEDQLSKVLQANHSASDPAIDNSYTGQIARLKADNEDLLLTFKIYSDAIERGTKKFREAHPEYENMLPDVAKMVEWLCSQLSDKDKRIAELTEQLQGERAAAEKAWDAAENWFTWDVVFNENRTRPKPLDKSTYINNNYPSQEK